MISAFLFSIFALLGVRNHTGMWSLIKKKVILFKVLFFHLLFLLVVIFSNGYFLIRVMLTIELSLLSVIMVILRLYWFFFTASPFWFSVNMVQYVVLLFISGCVYLI